MSEEVTQAEVLVPEQEATAAPVPEVSAPEVVEQQNEQQEEKKYSQAEIDAMIGKRLAREQRKWEREQAQRAAQAPQPSAPPVPEGFASTEEYIEAVAEYKAAEKIAAREAQKQQSEILEVYHDKEEEVRAKYDDFDQVAYNPNLSITTVMAQTIQASEVGPEVAYYLGMNPKEAGRISQLSPYLQAKEIGKLEAKLIAEPPTKKTSNAPAPIAPVNARSSGSPSYDTTDPRSVKTMSTSEWIEAERARQMKKWEAQRNR